MVWIPGGTFLMGSDEHYPEEVPARRVTVGGFWIDRHTVTNREFERFVRKTGYVTVAERTPDPASYPGAKPEMLIPASTVFQKSPHRVDLSNHYNWWSYVPGADWRHPQGRAARSRSARTIRSCMSPGRTSRPTRSGRAGSCPPRPSGSSPRARAWMAPPTRGATSSTPGVAGWPIRGRASFRSRTSSRTASREPHRLAHPRPNDYGLSDMIGNVWEWTTDWYEAPAEVSHACCSVESPQACIPRRVMKGGSHLCAPNSCQRYRPAARMPQPIDTSTSHLGFRTIIRG